LFSEFQRKNYFYRPSEIVDSLGTGATGCNSIGSERAKQCMNWAHIFRAADHQFRFIMAFSGLHLGYFRLAQRHGQIGAAIVLLGPPKICHALFFKFKKRFCYLHAFKSHPHSSCSRNRSSPSISVQKPCLSKKSPKDHLELWIRHENIAARGALLKETGSVEK
jgi:hypothetical protein